MLGRHRLHYATSSLFPMYFDHNATSPLLPAARQAWLDATEQFIGNPSSPHRIGARAEMALMPREKLWLHSWIAVHSRSSGPPVPRSRVTWFCITSRRRSVARLRFGFPRQSIRACCRAPATTFPAGIASSQLDGRGLSIWTGWKQTCARAVRVPLPSWLRTTKRASCSPGVRSSPVPAARGAAFLRWRAVDGKPLMARWMRICQRVRAQIRRSERGGISQGAAPRTILPTARRRTGSRAACRHGKRRWRPFNDRGTRES